jgi:hypothetical protein
VIKRMVDREELPYKQRLAVARLARVEESRSSPVHPLQTALSTTRSKHHPDRVMLPLQTSAPRNQVPRVPYGPSPPGALKHP